MKSSWEMVIVRFSLIFPNPWMYLPMNWRAACLADQTRADASIGGGRHCAFTYFFCKEMNACKNKLDRSAVLEKVRKDFQAGNYTQTPQLECEATVRNKSIG